VKSEKTTGKAFPWRVWLGLLISALFVYLALREVDLARMWLAIRRADPALFAIVILLNLFQYLVRAWRWGILIEPIKKTTLSSRLYALMIGFAANCILPARLGEIIRANYLGQREHISASSTFGTIVVERIFDGLTLLLFLMIGLMGTTFSDEWRPVGASLRATGLFLLVAYLLLISFLIGFKVKAKLFLSLLDRLLFLVPRKFRSKIIDVLGNFSLGLAMTRKPHQWVLVIFYSLLLWFASLCQIKLVELSIHLEMPLIAPFLVMAMASFGVMIPSAPGFIGTFHLSVQYAYLFYGIGKEEGLSVAILWHASFFFPTLILGLLSFLLLHVSPSALASRSGRPPA
jgi:glycosyltransferase 2 family protein